MKIKPTTYRIRTKKLRLIAISRTKKLRLIAISRTKKLRLIRNFDVVIN